MGGKSFNNNVRIKTNRIKHKNLYKIKKENEIKYQVPETIQLIDNPVINFKTRIKRIKIFEEFFKK